MKHSHTPKGASIELGLAISGATLPQGQVRDITEISYFCDCSKQLVHAIEKRAIDKVRKTLAKQGILSSADIY
jgi:hypothetical protein